MEKKQALRFVQKFPHLAVKMLGITALNPRLLEMVRNALSEVVAQEPLRFIDISNALHLYLKHKERDKFLCCIWDASDLLLNMKYLCMHKTLD